MGWAGFLAAQLTLGGSLLSAIMHAPLVGIVLAGLFTPFVSLEGWHAALFGVGYGGVIVAALVSKPKGLTLASLLTLPLYWPLLSHAMLRALFEMKTRPHFWAKTSHGVKPPRPKRLARAR